MVRRRHRAQAGKTRVVRQTVANRLTRRLHKLECWGNFCFSPGTAMELDCPHLSLARYWTDEDDDRRIALVDSLDALRLCNEGGFEAVSAADARWDFERESRRLSWEIQDFAASVGLARPFSSSCDDDDLADLVKEAIERGELVGLRKNPALFVRATKATVEQRRLVAQISAKTRGRLYQGGRQYKLVAGDDLDGTDDRNSYEVVAREDAQRTLDRMAKEPGIAAELAALLGKARDQLTRDWRPPLAPNGLILLRRSAVNRSYSSDSGPALTPSQMRKLAAKDWIEIEVVDQDGEPYSTHYRLELADQSVREGELDDEGSVGVYEIESGNCKVVLGEVKQAEAAEEAEEAEEPAEAEAPDVAEPEVPEDEPEPEDSSFDFEDEPDLATEDTVPTKLRFKLLDLAGKPMAGATVSIAGTNVTSDDDGMVETEVSQGPQNISATHPDGEVALSVGGLDPQDSSEDGFKMRLFNMGYLWDTNAETSDDEMVIALQDFQAQYKIELSGLLDDATKAKLVEVYGC